MKLEETVETKASTKNDQKAADAHTHSDSIGRQRYEDHQAKSQRP